MKKLTKEQREELKKKGFEFSNMTFVERINKPEIIIDIKDLERGTYVATLTKISDNENI